MHNVSEDNSIVIALSVLEFSSTHIPPPQAEETQRAPDFVTGQKLENFSLSLSLFFPQYVSTYVTYVFIYLAS